MEKEIDWNLVWFYRVYATLTIFQLYCGGQFYWWRIPEDQEKTTKVSSFISHYFQRVGCAGCINSQPNRPSDER